MERTTPSPQITAGHEAAEILRTLFAALGARSFHLLVDEQEGNLKIEIAPYNTFHYSTTVHLFSAHTAIQVLQRAIPALMDEIDQDEPHYHDALAALLDALNQDLLPLDDVAAKTYRAYDRRIEELQQQREEREGRFRDLRTLLAGLKR